MVMLAMSSAHMFLLLLLALIHVFVQADNGQVETSTAGTKPDSNGNPVTDDATGSDDYPKVSLDDNNLSVLFEKILNEMDAYHNVPTNGRTPRTKRWAEMDKRYYNGYASARTYSRYRYPSNLMALLRGTKRGWSDEPSYGRWRYPSNLMVLLRGKKSVMGEDGEDEMPAVEEAEDEPEDLQKKAAEEVMKRIAAGWRYYLDNYSADVPAKRSAFYGYSNDGNSGSISSRPFGSRQFLLWNGGRYILG